MLVDIVSRNGNLMLNFPLPNSGELDCERNRGALGDHRLDGGQQRRHLWHAAVEDLWRRAVNSQAFERCQIQRAQAQILTAEDVRFTTKAGTLYAFLMGWPEGEVAIAPLGSAGKVINVELLGRQGSLEWKQDQTGLRVQMPAEKPCDYAVALRINGAV